MNADDAKVTNRPKKCVKIKNRNVGSNPASDATLYTTANADEWIIGLIKNNTSVNRNGDVVASGTADQNGEETWVRILDNPFSVCHSVEFLSAQPGVHSCANESHDHIKRNDKRQRVSSRDTEVNKLTGNEANGYCLQKFSFFKLRGKNWPKLKLRDYLAKQYPYCSITFT